ncbi:MAG: hypothetical protein AAFX09_08890 [Pseudomonadota bacterium]
MPYAPRTEEERASIEARAREMRAGGASMAEIARSVGVPAATLYRWAAENDWRAVDLHKASLNAEARQSAQEDDAALTEIALGETVPRTPDAIRAALRRLRRALGGAADASGEQAVLIGLLEACSAALERLDTSLKAREPWRSAERLRAAARQAEDAALSHLSAGRVRDAETALKLVARFDEAADEGFALVRSQAGQNAPEEAPLEEWEGGQGAQYQAWVEEQEERVVLALDERWAAFMEVLGPGRGVNLKKWKAGCYVPEFGPVAEPFEPDWDAFAVHMRQVGMWD